MSPPRPRRDRGLSPAVGTALLLVIVVVLASVAGAALLGMTDGVGASPSLVHSSGSVDVAVAGDDLTRNHVVVVHDGGATVDVDTLELRVTTDAGTRTVPAPTAGDTADGTWSAGEALAVELTPAEVCSGPEVEVAVVQRLRSQSYVLAKHTMPVGVDGFVIDEGAVVPTTAYSADVTLLGAAFTYGPGGPDIDVLLDVVVGDTTHQPWPGDVNDGANPRTYAVGDQSAGAGLSVAATVDPLSWYLSPHTRDSTETDGWVAVLRDGDTPPNTEGFGDQDAAASYVREYVTEAGTVSLPPNRAIFLFELGTSRTGDAADYQDVVVLVTVTPDETASLSTEAANESRRIYCGTR